MKIFTHILFTAFLFFYSCNNNTSEEGIENQYQILFNPLYLKPGLMSRLHTL